MSSTRIPIYLDISSRGAARRGRSESTFNYIGTHLLPYGAVLKKQYAKKFYKPASKVVRNLAAALGFTKESITAEINKEIKKIVRKDSASIMFRMINNARGKGPDEDYNLHTHSALAQRGFFKQEIMVGSQENKFESSIKFGVHYNPIGPNKELIRYIASLLNGYITGDPKDPMYGKGLRPLSPRRKKNWLLIPAQGGDVDNPMLADSAAYKDTTTRRYLRLTNKGRQKLVGPEGIGYRVGNWKFIFLGMPKSQRVGRRRVDISEKVPAGIYAIRYRKEQVTRDLQDRLKSDKRRRSLNLGDMRFSGKAGEGSRSVTKQVERTIGRPVLAYLLKKYVHITPRAWYNGAYGLWRSGRYGGRSYYTMNKEIDALISRSVVSTFDSLDKQLRELAQLAASEKLS